MLDTIDAHLAQHEHLCGDAFTAADVYLGASLALGLRFGTIEDRPSFGAYVVRITSRPAAGRAAEIDDALLAGDIA